MSLIKLTRDKFEHFTLVTNPSRTFSSSSSGLTGSVNLFSRENRIIKEAVPLWSGSQAYDETIGVEAAWRNLSSSFSTPGNTNVYAAAELYMTGVEKATLSSKYGKTIPVTRFTASLAGIGEESCKKRSVINVLMPYYSVRYPSSQYNYTNYHTLNFFTASTVPSNTALIYPNVVGSDGNRVYTPTGSFTFDFQINPRYSSDKPGVDFHAGTIFHISSTIAVSLVTGSGVDEEGYPSGFRLMLQLSHSADISPSQIDLSVANNARSYPNDLIFLSNDNVLSRNKWHHVSIRWGTDLQNSGTGSFLIDSTQKGIFNVPSASITSSNGASDTPAVFVGNYYVGSSDINRFFNDRATTEEGVTNLTAGVLDPTSFSLTHPLNAEVHDVKLYKTYRDHNQVLTSSVRGPDNLNNLLFYLPVLFVRETRKRYVLRTPFYQRTVVETYDPFNVEYAFNVGGHLLNPEHFVREFVQGEYPRLYNLSASIYTGAVDTSKDANDYMYTKNVIRKRNLTVLPCDNGNFVPNFELLRSGSVTTSVVSGTAMEKFCNDVGSLDLLSITLRNLMSASVDKPSMDEMLQSNADELINVTPDRPDLQPDIVPYVFQMTRDGSSNQTVFFNVSNIFYGSRILPGSVTLTDTSITGSGGKVSIILKDNGVGGLYRANASGSHPTWATVGNVFYNEGMIAIKSPNIPLFGKDQYDLTFKGERKIFTTKMNVTAPAGAVNSSSNPTWIPLSASSNANDEDSEFVYITNVIFHDENLNVVARTNLAQPVIKRNSDKILFRVKLDW